MGKMISGSNLNNNVSQSQQPPLKNKSLTNFWKIGFFITFFLWLLFSFGLTYFFKVNRRCEKKIPQLVKIALPSSSPAPSIASPTPIITTVDKNVTLPVTVYTPPGLFNSNEKEELSNKIIKPFFDYNNEKEINFIAIIISKEPSEKYEYSFLAIHKNGGYHSSVISKQNDKFNYWFPECMGPCEFSQSYKEKYPEVVKLANP